MDAPRRPVRRSGYLARARARAAVSRGGGGGGLLVPVAPPARPALRRKGRHPLVAAGALSALLAAGALSPAPAAGEELRLAGIFSDHLVLQRGRPVPVWGWAGAGRTVTVEFAGQTASATAGDDGAWEVVLEALEASEAGRTLTVVRGSGGSTLTVADILVGEVWHASGQSNMAMTLAAVARRLPAARLDIGAADLPDLRFRRINEGAADKPQADLPRGGGWRVCSPGSAKGFSAAAFYFARALHRELGVPVGIIDSSRGGTPIEPFIPRGAFKGHPTLVRELELGDRGDLRGIWALPGGVRARDANWLPGRLFHSRVAPVARFAARGLVWYQGESNCGVGEDPRDYEHKMRALVNGWRGALGDAAMPCYYVQLPGSGAGPGWPYLREQQRISATLDGTGMAVTIDLVDGDIHPVFKRDVGERLARWALARTYGRALVPCGPLFREAEFSGGAATVHFDFAEGGLMTAWDGLAAPLATPGTPPANFEVADGAGRWHPAEAEIAGRTVVVKSPRAPRPTAVRYAYAVNPPGCNLYNREGLPAAPFCSHPGRLSYDPGLPAE